MSLQIESIINVKGIKELKGDKPNIYNGRLRLIYGINGSGKSTIKYIIKSLFENTKLTKNFNMEDKPQEVIIKINGNKYTYLNSWDKTPANDKLHIFDSNYIEENIYVNGKVSIGNKRNLPNIIFGKENILLYEDMVLLEEEVKELNDKNKDIIKSLTNSNFLTMLEELIKDLDFIKETLLIKQTYIKQVEDILLKHIKNNLENNEEARIWLKKGLTYYNKDCPMCGQSLNNEAKELFDIIDNSSLVDNNYEAIKKELDFKYENIKKLINNSLFTVKIGNKDSFLKQILEKINYKQSNFNEEVHLFEGNKLLKNAYFKIKDNIEAISNINNKDNRVILKRSSLNVIKDYENNVNAINRKSLIINKERETINKNLEDIIKKDLSIINDDLLSYGLPYELALNEMTDSFNTSITKSLSSLTTGLILKHKETDKLIKDNDIKDTLSYGEKSILAWVLFVTNLKRETNKGSNIIILDDPIASHDDSKKFPLINSVYELKKNKGNKIMLLTHEKRFVALYNNLNTSKTYLLNNNELTTMDVLSFFKNELIDNIHKIEENKDLNESNLIEYLVRARKLIESNALYSNTHYKDNKRWINAYNNISKVLHNESNRLFERTINTIDIIMRKHIPQFKTNININIENINILDVAIGNSDNIYSYRIIVENYLRFKLLNRYKLEKELTIGHLFYIVEKIRGKKYTHYSEIKSILNILNTTYHNDSSFGFGIKDIPEESLRYADGIIKDIMNHQFFDHYMI